MEDEIKLKCCPFCGSNDVRLMTYEGVEDGIAVCIENVDELESEKCFVHCFGCDTDVMLHSEVGRDALDAWNERL